MRQHRSLAKREAEHGGSSQIAIDEKIPPRANVRHPVSGKRGEDVMAKKKKAKKAAKKKAKKKKAKKAAKKKKAKKKSRRTVLYSSKGKKLYAVRDKGGKFKDIQSYKRAHGADIKRKAKAETAAPAADSGTPAAS
jgi:hypothetical protein